MRNITFVIQQEVHSILKPILKSQWAHSNSQPFVNNDHMLFNLLFLTISPSTLNLYFQVRYWHKALRKEIPKAPSPLAKSMNWRCNGYLKIRDTGFLKFAMGWEEPWAPPPQWPLHFQGLNNTFFLFGHVSSSIYTPTLILHCYIISQSGLLKYRFAMGFTLNLDIHVSTLFSHWFNPIIL